MHLPDGYREVRYFSLTSGRRVLWLNLLSLIPLAVALAVMTGWQTLILQLRGPVAAAAEPNTLLLVVLMLVGVLGLHEWIHGLAIRAAGHRPRYGFRPLKGVLYATADGVLFRRDTYIGIALAPLLVLTLAGMVLMVFVPDVYAYWIGLGVALNAAGAIGDVWVTLLVLRCPPLALVLDEADAVRIYAPETA